MRLNWYGHFGYCGTDPYSAAGQSLITHVTKEEEITVNKNVE